MNLGFEHQRWRNHFLRLLRKYFILFYFLPAKQVGNTYWNTSPENWVSTEHNIICVLEISFSTWCWQYCNFSLQNDGHNDSVNSDGFTENNAKLWGDIPDKIFRSDTRSFNSGTEDACSCNKNTPKIIWKSTMQLRWQRRQVRYQYRDKPKYRVRFHRRDQPNLRRWQTFLDR